MVAAGAYYVVCEGVTVHLFEGRGFFGTMSQNPPVICFGTMLVTKMLIFDRRISRTGSCARKTKDKKTPQPVYQWS